MSRARVMTERPNTTAPKTNTGVKRTNGDARRLSGGTAGNAFEGVIAVKSRARPLNDYERTMSAYARFIIGMR